MDAGTDGEKSRDTTGNGVGSRDWKQYVVPPVFSTGGAVRINATSCLNSTKFPQVNWGKYDIFFADPPYNIGVNYGSGSADDSASPESYVQFTEDWLRCAVAAVRPGGSLWILLPDEWAGVADYLCRYRIGGIELRNWIKWHETFGVQTSSKFARTSRHILYYVKSGGKFTFNSDAVKVPSDRQTKYSDPRAAAGGKVMGDVWTISRVAGTFKERAPEFKNQIPEELLQRIVEVGSDEGDKVLEFFTGSGSLARVCLEHGRSYDGWELSERNAEKAYTRVTQRATEIRQSVGSS